MRTPEGLLFDLGDTLLRVEGFDTRAGQARMVALASQKPARVDVDAIEARAEIIRREFEPRRVSSALEFGAAAVNRLLYGSLGFRFDRTPVELELEFWRAAMTMAPQPGVRAALDDARDRGLRLAVVSNSAFSETVLSDELERHGLRDAFEFVVSSVDYGFRKPHPMLYETSACMLGIAPEKLWFVGDRLDWDVAGPRAVGMRGVWYNPKGLDSDEPRDVELRAWSGLAALLDEAGARKVPSTA